MIQLHDLEAARRALPHLFPGANACCMLEWSDSGELCPTCRDLEPIRPEDDPVYRTLTAVLDHFLEARTSSAWCSLCNKPHDAEVLTEILRR